jgi:hypothetical protein
MGATLLAPVPPLAPNGLAVGDLQLKQLMMTKINNSG